MNIYSLLLIGFGVSVDSLAASASTGACLPRIKLWQLFKVATYMAGFQAFMPLIGWFIGDRFRSAITASDHWIALILLVIIGSKMIYESLKGNEQERTDFSPSNHLWLIGMAIATSIDALVIGISFGLVDINIALAITIIGVTTFSFSITGVLLGKKIGTRINQGVEIAGGVVLILLGFKIFISHVAL